MTEKTENTCAVELARRIAVLRLQEQSCKEQRERVRSQIAGSALGLVEAELTDHYKRLQEEKAAAEQDLREIALTLAKETGDKKPFEFASVTKATKMEITDLEAALDYAISNLRAVLTIDEKQLKKTLGTFSEEARRRVAGVQYTEEEYGAVRISTEITDWVWDRPEYAEPKLAEALRILSSAYEEEEAKQKIEASVPFMSLLTEQEWSEDRWKSWMTSMLKAADLPF